MDDNESGLVVTGGLSQKNHEKPPSLEEFNWQKGVVIPAGEESRRPVKILPKPWYIKINHGMRIWDFKETFTNPRTPDIYYAVYALGVFRIEAANKPDEIRLLRFPVVDNDDITGTNDKIFGELSKQTGEDERDLRRNSKPRDIQAIIWSTASKAHRSLRWILDPRLPKVKKGINGDEYRDDPSRDATIYSGWKDGSDMFQPNTNLVAIARVSGGNDWYIDLAIEDDIGHRDTTGTIISPPLPSETENMSDLDLSLLKGLITMNK